jgi:hypothetical protein
VNIIQNNQLTPIHIGWVKHLKTDDSKEEFKKMVMASAPVLRVLKALLIEEKRNLEISETNPRDFDTPNWAEKQAFRNGERRGLKLVEDLLHFI